MAPRSTKNNVTLGENVEKVKKVEFHGKYNGMIIEIKPIEGNKFQINAPELKFKINVRRGPFLWTRLRWARKKVLKFIDDLDRVMNEDLGIEAIGGTSSENKKFKDIDLNFKNQENAFAEFQKSIEGKFTNYEKQANDMIAEFKKLRDSLKPDEEPEEDKSTEESEIIEEPDEVRVE